MKLILVQKRLFQKISNILKMKSKRSCEVLKKNIDFEQKQLSEAYEEQQEYKNCHPNSVPE